jgi:hypothetical protein
MTGKRFNKNAGVGPRFGIGGNTPLRFTKKGRQTATPELVRDLVLDNPAPFVRFDHHQAPQGSQTWFSTPAR